MGAQICASASRMVRSWVQVRDSVTLHPPETREPSHHDLVTPRHDIGTGGEEETSSPGLLLSRYKARLLRRAQGQGPRNGRAATVRDGAGGASEGSPPRAALDAGCDDEMLRSSGAGSGGVTSLGIP